jgi:dTDP-4-dehydrorhamnose 3,5-epimerase
LKVIATALEGVTVIEPDVYRDERGFFVETYHAERYLQAGVTKTFVQDNQTRSVRGRIRLCTHSSSIRKANWFARLSGRYSTLSSTSGDALQHSAAGSQSKSQPRIFGRSTFPRVSAQGICILSEVAEIAYKCTDYCDPADELRIIWNDPTIAIAWPIADPILSPKDSAARTLADQFDDLPRFGDPAV